MSEQVSLHFIDELIEVEFVNPPVREKTPSCPDRFTWRTEVYLVSETLAEWSDYTRRGRAAQNMRPSHAIVAAGRGSLGVGRFFFRVRTTSGRCFEIYYDRAIKDSMHRKGAWYIYRELSAE